MQDKFFIKKSKISMQLQQITIGAGGLLLLFFTVILFVSIDNNTYFDLNGLTAVFLFFVFGSILIGMLLTYLNFNKLSYYATKDTLVIQTGLFGAKQKQIYELENTTGMSMGQSFFGSKYNYGYIIVELRMMPRIEQVRLVNVENPEQTLRTLHSLMKEGGKTTRL